MDNRVLIIALFLAAIFVLSSCSTGQAIAIAKQCNDKRDNDNDGHCDHNGCTINRRVLPKDTDCTSNVDNKEGPEWKLVFSDNFNTNVPVGGFSDCQYVKDYRQANCSGLPNIVKKRWFAYGDGWPDGQFGTYQPSRVLSIKDGKMLIKLHSEKVDGEWLHMAGTIVPKIMTAPGERGGLLYGRYAIRFKIDPPITGYKIAYLLWPDDNEDGVTEHRSHEIDFPEVQKDFTDTSPICAFIHSLVNGVDTSAYRCGTTMPADGNWHTAITEWTDTYLKFYLDGKQFFIVTDPARIPHKPMHWVLQNTAMVWQAVEPKNDAVVNIQIDWVKVWALNNSK